MKRLFCLILLLLASFTLPVRAASLMETDDGWQYTAEGDHAVIRGFDVTGYTLTLPSEIEGLPVTEIAPAAFYKNPYLTDIVIPSPIRTIGEGAFEGCTSLHSVTFEDGLTSLPDRCFADCLLLREVTFPATLEEIGEDCFSCCVRLGEVRIPAAVTSIAQRAFAGCESLVFDCAENASAKEYAASHAIPTDRFSPYAVYLELAGVTAGIGALVFAAERLRRKKKKKSGR